MVIFYHFIYLLSSIFTQQNNQQERRSRETMIKRKKKPDPLDNLYDHFKDDPNVDQNFLKYRIAREKEKRTLRYKIRCFLAKFHR